MTLPAYACQALAAGGKKCARWCGDCVASEALVSARAAIEKRYTDQGAVAPRGASNPYRAGCPAAVWWQLGNDALTAGEPTDATENAKKDVLAERERQRQKWGDQHDDEHTNDALADGAVSYLLPGQALMPADWAYKSKVKDKEPRRTQLVKGAALALAAIEQIDRRRAALAASKEQQQ